MSIFKIKIFIKNCRFGGAKISWIFHTVYAKDLDALMDSLINDLKTENIHNAVLQTDVSFLQKRNTIN